MAKPSIHGIESIFVVSSLYLLVRSVLHIQRAGPTSIDVSFLISSLKEWAPIETMDFRIYDIGLKTSTTTDASHRRIS